MVHTPFPPRRLLHVNQMNLGPLADYTRDEVSRQMHGRPACLPAFRSMLCACYESEYARHMARPGRQGR